MSLTNGSQSFFISYHIKDMCNCNWNYNSRHMHKRLLEKYHSLLDMWKENMTPPVINFNTESLG